MEPLSLAYVPDHFKTQEMCNEAVRNKLCRLLFVPDHFWTQEMRNEIMRTKPDAFHHIPNQFKPQEMCEKVVKDDSSSLEHVPDWFVTRKWVDVWYDNYYGNDGDHWDVDEEKYFQMLNGYNKRKTQKASIKEEFLTIVWHPSRYWDWCVPEDEKQGAEKLWT